MNLYHVRFSVIRQYGACSRPPNSKERLKSSPGIKINAARVVCFDGFKFHRHKKITRILEKPLNAFSDMWLFWLWHGDGRVNFLPRKTVRWTWKKWHVVAILTWQGICCTARSNFNPVHHADNAVFLLSCHVSMPWTQPNTRGWAYTLEKKWTFLQWEWLTIKRKETLHRS